jgi:hypothetical protein
MPKASSISAPLGNAIRRDCCLVAKVAQKQWDQAVLAPWKTVIGMAGDEQHELTVPTFMQQGSRGRAFDGEAAEEEGTGGKAHILAARLAA